MIKPLIILFNTVSVLFFSFFFGDSPVTVSGNFPKNAPIGSEFTAEVKVNKGSVSGFAKLQLEVPAGFTVKELDSKSGNFSFASNIAKIIWTSMPSDAEFTVKFTLSADASAAGSKVIASKFSYVSNNNKEVAEMTPAEITIGDVNSTPVAATTPVTSSANTSEAPVASTTSTENNTPTNTANTSFENPTEPNSNIVCSRKITNISSNSYNVEVRIKKGAVKGFAKFQEILPNGFNAKGDKLNGSSFSVSDGKLKFVWVSLPADEELVLSYILENTGTAAPETKLDNGEFSYLENDQSKKIKFPTDVITNNASTPVATSNNTNTEPVTPTAVATQTVTPEQVATQTQTTTPEPVANTNVTNTEPVKTEPTPSNTSANNTNDVVAKKQGNVVYNVQIGAFTNAIESSVLEKKFNISESIKSEMQGGYNKFMVGNFAEYKEARSHRETIKQKGCQSAFVVAYNGAKRITVQEALMITSQKWFK